jgi:thiamine biosynthesis protein ThiS
MRITVNGREIVFDRSTVQDLLDQYKMNPSRIRVEKNGKVVDRSSFTVERLNEGDMVEINRCGRAG